MEDEWEIYSKGQLDNSSKLKINDIFKLVEECHSMLVETKQNQKTIIKMVSSLQDNKNNKNNKIQLEDDEVVTQKDSNYTNTVRESNRAWRLYGNHYKPILPMFSSGIYTGFNNDFLTNINNTNNDNTINTDENNNQCTDRDDDCVQ